MIFLPNKQKQKKRHSNHHGGDQIQMGNMQQQQHNNLSRQQIVEIRRNQISRNEQKNREKVKDTILKVLAFCGSIFLLAGIGLLIFGIVQSQMFGYISGGILIGGGIILLTIMVIMMCSNDKNTDEELRRSHLSSRTQVTPNV